MGLQIKRVTHFLKDHKATIISVKQSSHSSCTARFWRTSKYW